MEVNPGTTMELYDKNFSFMDLYDKLFFVHEGQSGNCEMETIWLLTSNRWFKKHDYFKLRHRHDKCCFQTQFLFIYSHVKPMVLTQNLLLSMVIWGSDKSAIVSES